LPANAEVLMLGSFPPPKARWVMNFFYPNFQNDMWRILGIIFFNDKNYFINENLKSFDENKIRLFLSQKGIALYDSAVKVRRLSANADDKLLEVIEALNFKKILAQMPKCKTVILTGQKAAEILSGVISFDNPKTGRFSTISAPEGVIKIYRAPSSSRAYPKPLEEKAKIYKEIFKQSGLTGL
jgi:G:T/U-mismatch repair DNA glycosylase